MDTFLVGFLGGVVGTIVVLALVLALVMYKARQAQKQQTAELEKIFGSNPELAAMFGAVDFGTGETPV